MTEPRPARVVALFCSEPRMESPFAAFLRAQYPGDAIERVSVPGGPWWLARANAAHSTKVGRWVTSRVAGGMEDALRGMLGAVPLQAIELLGHEGCEWYARLARTRGAGELVRLQGEDLLSAAREAARWTKAPVRAHFLLRGPDGGFTGRSVVS